MTDKRNLYSGRQNELSAVLAFDYSTFVEDDVTQVFALPAGAVITGVALQVRTAWDNTTPTLAVGLYSHDNADPDNFLDDVSLGTGDETFQINMFDAGTEANLDASDANHVDVPTDSIAVLYKAASGTAAAGAATLIVRYVVRERSTEVQG